ncbi:recombinase family protein [Inquilinus sp. Marseille-Q2685]|uniref:recombinase family protein n=1 Tax=Inquilinus sp. Marseille-Q2685 TaxID=2866581 RepID=UPI001CE4220F|nr:recombinase family protein [Inquilinus sp. Marseille-Q2685]
MTQHILYARVSTADQTISHQKAQAEAAGFTIDRVVEDHGVSGVNTAFAHRPGGARLLDILRPGDVLVVRWVDRLGRNYQDVTDTIRELMRRGVVVKTVINRMVFDGATADPIQQAVRDALIGFMAATAQAQAEATKEAQRAGIEHAKAKAEGKYLGRKPSFTRAQLDQVRDMLAQGAGHSAIAKETGLTRAVVWRIEGDPTKAEAALAAWEKAPAG